MNKYAIHLMWFLVMFTPEAQGTPEAEFPQFSELPIDLQAHVLSFADKPQVALQLNNRAIYNKAKRSFMWAKPDQVILRYIHDAFGKDGELLTQEDIVKALYANDGLLLMRRLLWLSAAQTDEADKLKIRALLTHRATALDFFCRDALIEISRRSPKLARQALKLVKGQTAYGQPLVHSSQLPEFFKQLIDQAEVVHAITRPDHSTFKIWRLASYPNLYCLTTVGMPNQEEYVVANLEEADGRIPEQGVRVVYHDNELHDWPLPKAEVVTH